MVVTPANSAARALSNLLGTINTELEHENNQGVWPICIVLLSFVTCMLAAYQVRLMSGKHTAAQCTAGTLFAASHRGVLESGRIRVALPRHTRINAPKRCLREGQDQGLCPCE